MPRALRFAHTLALLIAAAPVAPVAAATLVAPVTTTEPGPPRHQYFADSGAGARIVESYELVTSPLAVNPALYDRIVAELRAPQGYKFVFDPAPAP